MFFSRFPLRILLSVVARPKLTLLIAGILCVLCILLGIFHLPISTDQNKLFSEDVPFFHDFVQFEEKFPENDAAYVVLELKDPARPVPTQRWTAAADAIASRLRAMPSVVRSVYARVPSERLGDAALLFEDPAAVPTRLAEAERGLPMIRLWAESPSFLTRPFGNTSLERFINFVRVQRATPGLSTKSTVDESAPLVTAIARSMNEALAEPAAPLTVGKTLPDLHSLGAESPRDLGYFYQADESDPSRHILLIQVYPRENYTSLTFVSEVVEGIRAAAGDAAKGFPEFHVGVTGRPALDADEMRTTDRDSTRAEVLAMSAVFLGLILFLRSFRLALAAVVSLCVGIALTFGWAALAVGELNLLSLVFFIALIGIGMDYFVQLLSRYRVESARRGSPRTIWVAVFRQVAAPVTTACLGAAGAFFVSRLTDFKGAASLGVIAGGGLILCLLSGFTVLPAFLTLFPKRMAIKAVSASDGQPTGKRRLFFTPIIWLIALAAMVPFARRAEFDGSLLNLQAPNLESVRLVRKLQTWSAVALTKDLATLRRAKVALAGSSVVSGTESILNAYENAEWLKAHNASFRAIVWTAPDFVRRDDLERLASSLRSLGNSYADAGKMASPAPKTELETASDSLMRTADKISTAIASGRADEAADRLSAWQVAFVGQLRSMLAQFDPGPIDLAQLPDELRTHLIAADGTYALYITPKEDLWQRENLQRFVVDIETVLNSAGNLPAPTGIAVDIHHTTEGVQHAFLLATAYAIGLILLLVLIDLRHLGQTLLAISVLALGLPMLIGIMGLLGISWNLANFFGLPILIGAGHEYGVFMVHRYREALRSTRRTWRGWDASDWALLLCAYVTTASFAFFWLMANHRGLKSLGLVMALGTACIYLATIGVLRPLLKWMLERKSGRVD